MNTSAPLDPRSLAHRLTMVGHALHHRLFAQLRDSDLHPKTLLVLSAIDGRIDAPWVIDRLARGGTRVTALAERGWIVRTDDGWVLTDEGRAVLDRVDADRSTLLADIPADELDRLVAALDAVSAALGISETDTAPFGRGRGPGMRGFGRGFGFSGRGRGPAFGPVAHGFEPDAGAGEYHGPRGDDGADGRIPHRERAHADHGRGCDPRGGHGHHRAHAHHGRGHDDRRSAQSAYERGFDSGFRRGRESSASGEPTASE